MSLWILLVHLLFQGPMFPGPGMPNQAPVPAFDKKGFNSCGGSQCAGSPPSQSVTVNATAGTVVTIYVSSCGSDLTCNVSSAGKISSVTLAGGNTPLFDAFCDNTASGNVAISLYHVQNYSGGSNALAVTYASGAGWYGGVSWASWTNVNQAVNSFDQSGCGSGTGTAPAATTSGNLSQSNELLYAFGGGGNTIAVAGGQTLLNAIVSTEIDAYKIGGAAGSTASATFAQSSHNYTAMVGAFKHQ